MVLRESVSLVIIVVLCLVIGSQLVKNVYETQYDDQKRMENYEAERKSRIDF